MKALLIANIQNDFIKPSGAIPIKDGEKVVPVANRMMVDSSFDFIVSFQEWHPPNHKSFASINKVKPMTLINSRATLPDHCRWSDGGAEFHKNLLSNKIHMIIRNGVSEHIDAHSAFSDCDLSNNNKYSTGLLDMLKGRGISNVFILGLSVNNFIRNTWVDAHKFGLQSSIIEDGFKSLNDDFSDYELKTIHSSSLLIKRK